MAARNCFFAELYSCLVFRVNRIFKKLAVKSLYLYYLQKKKCLPISIFGAEKKFYCFYVRAAIDREDPGVDYEISETKPSTRLLLYLSLAALYVTLVYLIYRWLMLDKMTKTLSVPIVVAIKVILRRKDA